MRGYVEVSRAAMVAALEKAGFLPFNTGGRGSELGYFRQHTKDTDIEIRIYTSLPARIVPRRAAAAKTAIRMVAIFDDGNKNFPICKMPRVHRTGSEAAVIERMLERARDCWRFVNLWLRTPYAERKNLQRPKFAPKQVTAKKSVTLTEQCGHKNATIRNCPYVSDLNGDYKQRCRCCESCAQNCGDEL